MLYQKNVFEIKNFKKQLLHCIMTNADYDANQLFFFSIFLLSIKQYIYKKKYGKKIM